MNWVKKTEEYEVCKDCEMEVRDGKLRCSYCNLRVCYCEGYYVVEARHIRPHLGSPEFLHEVCNKCACAHLGLEIKGRQITRF